MAATALVSVSVALQFWTGSASLGHLSWKFCSENAVLDLGVGDGSMLLPEMQSQLTLVAKVQIAFLTLESNKHFLSRYCSINSLQSR